MGDSCKLADGSKGTVHGWGYYSNRKICGSPTYDENKVVFSSIKDDDVMGKFVNAHRRSIITLDSGEKLNNYFDKNGTIIYSEVTPRSA